ncbi:hypothetical protein LRM35_24400 [Klebsiella variicola subsp. variicola]|nr:hypothetical protein LRM35_24400 [Klebsiella variicola subsp. variicola]
MSADEIVARVFLMPAVMPQAPAVTRFLQIPPFFVRSMAIRSPLSLSMRQTVPERSERWDLRIGSIKVTEYSVRLAAHFDRPQLFPEQAMARFPSCLARVMSELKLKNQSTSGDLRETIRRYNGKGERAQIYADHVLIMYDWMKKNS